MERFNKETNHSNKKKVAVAIASGILATSAVVGCNSEKGGATFGGSIFSEDVPYGVECINHPENVEFTIESPEDRGVVLSSMTGISGRLFYDLGYINSNNELSDELVTEAIESINGKNGPYVVFKDNAGDQFRKSAKKLIDNYVHVNNSNYVPNIRIHAYGDKTNANACAAWSDGESLELNIKRTNY